MPAPMNKYAGPDGKVVVIMSDKDEIETPKGKFKRVKNDSGNVTAPTIIPATTAPGVGQVLTKPVVPVVTK